MTAWRMFSVALLVPIAFTALVMVAVQRNRSSARAPIELTERELSLSGGDDENSGMSARLMWSYEWDIRSSWLTADKLQTLGFDVARVRDASGDEDISRALQRRAYLVMALTDQPGSRSRLAPVDAGLDLDALRDEYPDGRLHLITAAVIGLRPRPRGGAPMPGDGYVVSIDPASVYVPAEFTTELRRRNRARAPFTLAVRYGDRLEPWIVGMR